MAHLFSISYLSYKLRKIRFFLLLALTLIVMFYYSFLNEEYSLNQYADEETLPRITNENEVHGSKGEDKGHMNLLLDESTTDDLSNSDVLKEKNKYFPILEIEPSKGRKDEFKLPEDYFRNQKGTNLRKHKKKFLYPIGTENLIKFPKVSKKENYPGVQSTYFNDGGKKDQDKLDEIKKVFHSTWKTYKENGYGHDEVRPISHKAIDPFNGWSSTIIDALDTIWIIGEKAEFEEAVEFIKKINFKQSYRDDIPVFENVIRVLGGLIGAYDLSNEESLLTSAVEFANFLIEAFDTPNHMPLLYHEWQSEIPNKFASKEACLAEVGSLSLEFSRLTQLTGDNKFYDAIARITEFFEKSADKFFMKGLVPNKIDISGCRMLTREEVDDGVHLNNPKVTKSIFDGSYVYCIVEPHFVPRSIRQKYSLGGLADSYYEYLPKMYHLLRGEEKHAAVYKNLYLAAVSDIKNYMLFQPKVPDSEDILFVSSIAVTSNQDKFYVEQELDMQHLTCFAGGMLGLGARLFNRPDDLEIASKLTKGCVKMYEKLDIMPEILRVDKMRNDDDVYKENFRLEKFHYFERTKGNGEIEGGVRYLDPGEANQVKQKILRGKGGEKAKRKAAVIVDSKNDQGEHKADPIYEIITSSMDDFPPIEVLESGKLVWTVENTHNQPIWVNSMVPKYILRPEAIESVFYMYRITGDSNFRDYGWKMFQNIVSNCRDHEGNFASLRDITIKGARPDNFEDSLESFWFSETLKYFYLLFDDISVLSLDDYVLNTEAHPFKLVN